jgi:Short repeat of unknown function (DUF308)
MSSTSPQPSSAAAAAVEGATRLWWLTLIAGIVWTIYGMFVLSLRPTTIWSLAILIGFGFIFGGVGQILIAGRVDSWKWLFYVGALLSIIAGITAFVWPGMTLRVLSIFLAWVLVIGGIFSVVSAFAGQAFSLRSLGKELTQA